MRRDCWTEKEDRVLIWHWTSMPIHKLARKLGRTAYAVEMRAKILGFSARSRDTKSISQLSRESGFDFSTIKRAISALGLLPDRAVCTNAKNRQPTAKKMVGLSEEQCEKILTWIKGHVKGDRLPPDGPVKSAKTWGARNKPSACIECGRSGVPYYCKGMCKTCYMKNWKRRPYSSQSMP